MADYKHTLNLPQTEFPMRANLAQREPERLRKWQALDLHGKLSAARKNAPPFVFVDGPPYANGDIHIGHAVNKVLKDIVCKSRSLSGHHAPFIPGWDCHGLPIELVVEKKLGKPGDKVTPREFRDACRKYAREQMERQREDFIRLGVIADWEHPYLTMDPAYEADQLRALARIIERGALVKGAKPVHWCLDCGSALAEAEVEYEERTSPAVDVKFELVNDHRGLTPSALGSDPSRSASLVIWTTTPWTLPANRAVAVHPDLEYAFVNVGTETLVVAEALVEAVMKRAGIDGWKVERTVRGRELEHAKLRHPFYDLEIPVILADHVTLESGTGAVHTAPGHGQEDFIAGQAYGLEVYNPVGPNGVFLPGTGLFDGQFVFKANDAIVEVLRERGRLLHHEKYQHSYPHCWRHKTPVIFRATPQWFISMDAPLGGDQQGLRETALQEITKVRWLPSWGEQRIHNMLAGRPDWCISRQRTWGVPIALFVHRVTGEPHPDSPALLEQVAQRVEKGGIDVWFDLDPADLLGADAADWEKVNDVMDVWLDSGVVHACVQERREGLAVPADLYLEGSDQHRGWFQSSLLTSVAMRGTAPYRSVLTHGFTVDAQGRKMSKSVGNVVAPQKVVGSLGADILRLWVAATDYRGEMSVSDEILNRMADSYRRLRNTSRFLLANLAGFDPARHALAPSEMLALDRWLLQRAEELQQQVVAAYDSYEFHQIYQRVHNFCVVDLGSFYLDIIKDRQYTTQADSRARRSAQTAMFHVAEAMVRWLAPIMSFTADEIWENLPGARAESVLLSTWYEFPEGSQTNLPELQRRQAAANAIDWRQVRQVREAVSHQLEALRASDQIGSSLDAEVELYCAPALRESLTSLEEELRFVLITSDARLHDAEQRPTDAKPAEEVDGLWVIATASAHPKCVRCWHRRPDIGQHAAHPELCGRCVDNVDGSGESREYA